MFLVIVISFTDLTDAMTLPSEGVYYLNLEPDIIEPANYTIIPIDDGTEIVPITGWKMLERWDYLLSAWINHVLEDTPLAEFYRTTGSPMLALLLSGGLGFCLAIFRGVHILGFSSSPEKILACVTTHPGCRQKLIIRETGCSRGSVAYHLHRLEKNRKIHAIPYRKQTYYYAKDMAVNSVEHAVFSLIESKVRHTVFVTILHYPGITRQQIAELLDKSPDTVSYHLRYFDESVVSISTKQSINHYTITPKAAACYLRLNLPGCETRPETS